jgi:Arc/MetJ-type ribon-helix-helix transcriptional regulator
MELWQAQGASMIKKSVVVSTRLSLQEYKILELIGKEEGTGASEFIRFAIREAAEKRGLSPLIISEDKWREILKQI